MKIMFTGDINFRGIDGLDYAASRRILADVIPYIEEADFVIPNLECPLGDREKYLPIKKSGPNLICAENNIDFLKAMNAYAVTLANNHIGDYGEAALENTLKLLDESGIGHVGAGENISGAYDALRIRGERMTVSVLSVCENEFGMATEKKAGSAGYDPRRLLARIREEKQISDAVIVVFHGGNEFDPLPSPDTVERYRLICDMGADAVVAGHTHCPQGYETYNGKPIIYSMGNFLFTNSSRPDEKDSWYYGYFTLLDIKEDGISFSTVPYRFDKLGSGIKVFSGEEKRKMDEYISGLSAIIGDPALLKKYFKGWAMEHIWVPSLPNDLDDISDYDPSGNYNLLKCEAHLSQAKQIFEILFEEDLSEARVGQAMVKDLQKMPV